jgi:hypothetical protein
MQQASASAAAQAMPSEPTTIGQSLGAIGFPGQDAGGSAPGEQSAQCNVPACERFYHSFRASDCTYQPYAGPRQLCER